MDGKPSNGHPRLSRRERQTLLYTAAGKNRVQIGRLLGVDPSTVRTYQQRFTTKLGAVNPQHAASRAMLLGEFKKLATLDTAAHRQPE
jgi:DNA-binding HTH domain-containing proteins